MVVSGYIERFIFTNPEGTFGVFVLVSDDFEDGEMVCTGVTRGFNNGDFVELEGEITDHKKFGIQFKFRTASVKQPEGAQAIEKYLASGAIKGIGAVLASRIVKQFGEDSLRIMEEEPERLAQVRGISPRIARNIAIEVSEKRDVRDVMMFLQQFGISNKTALKIYDRYGQGIYGIMKENPYKIAEDIRGIGFKSIDEIARKSGIPADSNSRKTSGMHYVLTEGTVNGNVYLPKEELKREAQALLGTDCSDIDDILLQMAMDKKIIQKGDKVFLSYMYYAEMSVAVKIKEINENAGEYCDRESFDKKIDDFIKKHDCNLDLNQRDAVFEAVNSGVFILTGGPGTGKSTTISAIINFFYYDGLNVALAAPTGKAAKKLEERTGFAAKTIHRLLEVNGKAENDDIPMFNRNEDNPLEEDVFIIDEMSMTDIHLFKALLDAIPVGGRLILAGDVNQLPSVGPGNVLKDLIESNAYRCRILEKIYRQTEDSDIIVNAHKINKGIMPVLDNKSKDFFFLRRDQRDIIYRDLILLVRDKLPKQFQTTCKEIQVLCPMRKGLYGIENINRLMQEQLNPRNDNSKEVERGEVIFRTGDKVMQIKNNYEAVWTIRGKNGIVCEEGKGIFNGDVGEITDIYKSSEKLCVKFEDQKEVEYAFSELEELELAYAITIHKSQGGEYPCCVIPIVDGPEGFLSRRLLYTAVTRASKCVIILGNPETLSKMVANSKDRSRYTDLKERITERI